MHNVIFFLSILFLSYLIGSFPTAYILVRILKKQDIRKLGSGNVGATNASRILGKPAGLLVLLIDILKGIICVLFLGDYLLDKMGSSFYYLRAVLGFLAVAGHNWPIFLNFKGGKGVATTFGVLLGLALRIKGLWWILLSCFLVWIIALFISRIVSLASISTAIILPFLMHFFKQPKELVLLSSIFSFFIFFRHIPNLKRISKGKEPRI